MKLLTLLSIVTLATLAGCSQHSKKEMRNAVEQPEMVNTSAGTTQPSQESIFQLADSFETQNAKPFTLAMLNGKPTLVGMIFTNCTYACSRLTGDMKNIADSLSDFKGKVHYLLVSFDTERDQPEQLKKFADKMGLDSNWTLLHGTDEAVRTLAVLLNVQYDKDASGNFSHSNLVSVLDKNGVFKFQQEGLFANHSETIRQVKAALAAK